MIGNIIYYISCASVVHVCMFFTYISVHKFPHLHSLCSCLQREYFLNISVYVSVYTFPHLYTPYNSIHRQSIFPSNISNIPNNRLFLSLTPWYLRYALPRITADNFRLCSLLFLCFPSNLRIFARISGDKRNIFVSHNSCNLLLLLLHLLLLLLVVLLFLFRPHNYFCLFCVHFHEMKSIKMRNIYGRRYLSFLFSIISCAKWWV